MSRELMNEFEADCVMRCVHGAGRSARITADVVERSLLVLARSRQLLRGSVGRGTARALEMNREAELHRLAVADEHIAAAECAVSKQIVELEKIRAARY